MTWLQLNKNTIYLWITAIVMIVGLLFYDWSPGEIIITYFLETIIIGVVHIFKLYAVALNEKDPQTDKRKSLTAGLGVIVFFCVHYFFFIYLQSVFAFEIIKGYIEGIEDGFSVIHNYIVLLSRPNVIIIFWIIATTSALTAVFNFFIPRRYLEREVMVYIYQPYLRIIVQQLVVLLSSFLLIFSGSGLVAALLLIVLRLLIGLFMTEIGTDEAAQKRFIERLASGNKPEEVARTLEQLGAILQE